MHVASSSAGAVFVIMLPCDDDADCLRWLAALWPGLLGDDVRGKSPGCSILGVGIPGGAGCRCGGCVRVMAGVDFRRCGRKMIGESDVVLPARVSMLGFLGVHTFLFFPHGKSEQVRVTILGQSKAVPAFHCW